MNRQEKEARERLAKLRSAHGQAVHVTRKGGRDVDNFDTATVKNRNVFQNISDSIKTIRGQ
jgi:Na+-translocating ferredoxin:NAD+ oxidoreductase RnfG subunit